MSERTLSFANEDEAIAEIDRLRAGGYRKTRNWTLPMMCWHVGRGADQLLNPPPSDTPTPEQAARKQAFLDVILETGRPPGNFEAPPDMTPAPDCGEAEIDRYRDVLNRLKTYPHAKVNFGPFGPVDIASARKLMLMHTAHHLGFLIPNLPARRHGLQFNNEDEVIEEVKRLRRGHTQSGKWSLPQICWHLDRAIQSRMQPGPFPPNTPEQDGRRETLKQVLASGKLPSGIEAPQPMTPPPDAAEEAIDSLIATLETFKSYRGPIAPHRLFGHLEDVDARRLNLIHCAHHLSYLSPM